MPDVPPAALPPYEFVVVDLETLGVGADAVVATLGATRWRVGYGEVDALYVRIDLDQPGRSFDASTVTWWMRRAMDGADAAREVVDDDRIDLSQALLRFAAFIPEGADVWARGTDFDLAILAHAYRAAGMDAPWDFWRARDARTAVAVAKALGVDVKRGKSPHNALADARLDAEVVASVMAPAPHQAPSGAKAGG